MLKSLYIDKYNEFSYTSIKTFYEKRTLLYLLIERCRYVRVIVKMTHKLCKNCFRYFHGTLSDFFLQPMFRTSSIKIEYCFQFFTKRFAFFILPPIIAYFFVLNRPI